MCISTFTILQQFSAAYMLEFWFVFTFFFLFLEMGHPGLLYFLAFSCGSFFACVAACYQMNLLFQLIMFITATCAAVCAVYLILKNTSHQLITPSHRSNLDALIGRKVVVFQSLGQNQVWQAKISGQIWLVKTIHDKSLHVGQQAIIVDVQGCHLRIDPL